MTDEENIFAEMEAEGASVEEKTNEKQPISTPGEINYEALSDVAIGDQKKYERQNLDGKIVGIKSFQVFGATSEDEEITAMNGSGVKYKKSKIIITYDTKNKDDINDREYLSGAIQFVQKDGTLSVPNFYYDGADNQVSSLWKLVANHKNIEPEELSPRAFVAFMNSGIKVKLADTKVMFKKVEHHKNLPIEIVA